MTIGLGHAKLRLTQSTRKRLKKVSGPDRALVASALRKFRKNPLDQSLKFEKYKGRNNLYTIRASYHLRVYMADLNQMEMEIIHIGNHDFGKRVR